MRLTARTLVLAVTLALLLVLGVVVAVAGAAITYTPCGDSNDYACGHLTVPLDPGGSAGGTLTLAIRRHRAPVGEAHSAIIALAGGPGQAALPFAEQFSEVLGAIGDSRDLITFDQRGTGLSHALACHAFERAAAFRTISALVQSCASQLGAERSFYTTADSVADIEAIRQAGGYEKLVLYGTSYGTKVAELYAQQYPQHVEGLVLDSVVTPSGPDPLDRPTFAAIPRILRQLCAGHDCAGVTREPVADLAMVIARADRGALNGRAIDGSGHAHTVRVSAGALFEALLAGDFAPSLRAGFVTAVSAAARGDSAPLARLLSTGGGDEGEHEDFDTPLYYATTCEEEQFPWNRGATAKTRIAEARAYAAGLAASTFAPFTDTTAVGEGDIPACSVWPYATPAPAPDTQPLPSVPALIISGEDDLRTPTSGARLMAAAIPGSHLLVVPYTGHSVLGEEPTPCAKEALQALFAGTPVQSCAPAPTPAVLRPPPLPPRSLEHVSPSHGYHGRVGRTLHAVALSLQDLARQLALQLGLSGAESLAELFANLRTGGLRAGWAAFADSKLNLHGYSYIPGLTISGSSSTGATDLTIAGSAAAHGALRESVSHGLIGTLEGQSVRLPESDVAAAAIVGANVEASSPTGYISPARRALPGELAGLLPGIFEP